MCFAKTLGTITYYRKIDTLKKLLYYRINTYVYRKYIKIWEGQIFNTPSKIKRCSGSKIFPEQYVY